MGVIYFKKYKKVHDLLDFEKNILCRDYTSENYFRENMSRTSRILSTFFSAKFLCARLDYYLGF